MERLEARRRAPGSGSGGLRKLSLPRPRATVDRRFFLVRDMPHLSFVLPFPLRFGAP